MSFESKVEAAAAHKRRYKDAHRWSGYEELHGAHISHPIIGARDDFFPRD